MLIGGLQKTSLIDYPGKVSAIVFTQGCNFRCPYCHNPELVDPRQFGQPISVSEVRAFLQKRKGLLDAVVITGGEPSLHSDLPDFIREVRDLGYLIKLDTNGSKPEVLEKLIRERSLDYLAMDVKAPLEKYREITQSDVDSEAIKKSIELIMASGIDYEFRTTLPRNLLSYGDVLKIGKLLAGADRYVLQGFVAVKTLNQEMLDAESFTKEELSALQTELSQDISHVSVR